MKTFSIAELEKYSLIKAHTFRTWEQRFDVFKSTRADNNRRVYTIEELEFLLNFCLLNRLGNKVSELAILSKNAIEVKVLGLKGNSAKQEQLINRLIVDMFSLDIERFELTLKNSLSSWGTEETVEEIILPFLERLELFSYKGRTSSEYHFVVTAIRKRLLLAIDTTSLQQANSKSVLLFLPEGEHYDLLLLYLNYKLRKTGFNVLYLGTNISAANLHYTLKHRKPNFVVTYVPSNDEKYMKKLPTWFLHEDNSTSYFVATATLFEKQSSYKAKFISYKEILREMVPVSSDSFFDA